MMVDVDRRMNGLNPAHIAGLRRLSARAAPTYRKPPSSDAEIPHSSPTKNFITRLRSSGVSFTRGLSDPLSSGSDLETFFERESLPRSFDLKLIGWDFDKRSLDSLHRIKATRWAELRRDSSSPERFELPEWVRLIESVLRKGGWAESDVFEILHVPACRLFNGKDSMMLDSRVILEKLLMEADRLSDMLRMGGWSSEEVAEMLGYGFDFRVRKVPAKKTEKPAESVALT